MTNECRIVDVWLGSFESEDELAAYLAESYSNDDDDLPISRFAVDQDQWFYDHDFMESCFFSATTDLRVALGRCSFISSYIDDVVVAHEAIGLPSVNTALLVFGAAIRIPKSVAAAEYHLNHLGRFASDPGP